MTQEIEQSAGYAIAPAELPPGLLKQAQAAALPTVIQNAGAAPVTLTQSGANGVQIASANQVNMPVQVLMVPSSWAALSAPPIVEKTNRDYYQLLVVTDLDVSDRHVSFHPERALTESMCPSVQERLQSLDSEAIRELKTFPALIMAENEHYGQAGEEQLAHVGTVTKIRVGTQGIKLTFQILFSFPQQVVNDNLEAFDLYGTSNLNELNRTHWTVKNVDLLDELAELGISAPTETLNGGTQ